LKKRGAYDDNAVVMKVAQLTISASPVAVEAESKSEKMTQE